MKNINKRSDARSYSPLSFLANSSMTKANRPENTKNRFLPPDIIATWSLKPLNTGSQPKNTVSCNYKRSRKKKASTNLNNTISHDDTQDDSFCNETPANMSYIDIRSNKNISQNRDLFQGTMKEKGNKSREIKNENIGFNVDKRYYSNIKTMLFQQGSQQQMLDRLISNKRGRSSSKKEESSFNFSMISREKNHFPAFIPPKKQQERVKICPKLTPVKNKTKDEIRNEKLTLIEKTYSLSPHKTKNSKSPKILDATNLDKSIVHTTSKKNKLNKTDEKFYQMKSPLEATRQRTTSKDGREKNLHPPPRYRTPKVSGQTQSPTDYRYSKDTSSILLRKDESWAKNSVRTNNTSQVKVVTENTSRNNKDLLSVSSIVQCHSRTPMDNNTSMLSKDDEYSSHMFHSISKQISQSSNRDFNTVNPSGASEKAYAKPTPAKRGRKFKTEVNFNQRCYTVSNNSISNIFESAEIAEMNSQRHMSIGGRLSTMENEADKSYEIYQQTESGVYTPNKHTLKPPKDEFTPLMRQESFENALDEFAEKSVQVSVQDHNQSFALSSMGKAQFDELLGASLISYLNDKGTVHDHASKKEIETTLSISKHPVFKRSRVFVSKGINSTDKDGLQMISTNANSKATYKNDSVQLKSVKEEFFQSEAGIEKNSVLEIDFNFGEDMKPFKGSNNLIGNQVSPSFPAQVPSQSKFSQKPLLDNQEIDILNKKHVIKKKNSYDLETLRVSDDEKSDKNSETRENQTPKVIRASLAQPMLFYSGNKMNKPGGLFRVEQSFNENPMNSLNSFGSGRNPGKLNNNGFEDSQS